MKRTILKYGNGSNKVLIVGLGEYVPKVDRDALVEAIEWALERAEPEVRETDNSMDQMMLIKYQTLLQEVKG